MNELLIPVIIFGIWTIFSVIFIWRYKRYQTDSSTDKKSFWNNTYIFESIPPVFPTLGIFCTALGITIGIWNFNTNDIQSSIPELLKGLRLAFIATMAGIIGLIIFQKVNAIIQKQIDDNPNRQKEPTDELAAINELTIAVQEMKKDNAAQIGSLIQSFGNDLENKVSAKLTVIETQIVGNRTEITEQLKKLREEQNATSEKANKNTDEIIKAMSENNKLTANKFDEFSELLRQNNTEALVEVMKHTTEQFNAQMSELINRLVQENFAELNNSVRNLNDWQNQNKEQVQKLTEQFQQTTEMFNISATTLKEVAANTKALTEDNGKLSQIVQELNKVMIEDGKFQEITNKLTTTVETLENTAESFDDTTSKLNEWVVTEKNFKLSIDVLVKELEKYRDFNGSVWDNYRNEMDKSVSILKDTSKRLSDDLEGMNTEFIARLNDTLISLDECIQRFVPTNRR